MRKTAVLLLLASMLFSCSDRLQQFSVSAGDFEYLNCPVKIELSSINGLSHIIEANKIIELYEVTESGRRKIPCQISLDGQSNLWFIHNRVTPDRDG